MKISLLSRHQICNRTPDEIELQMMISCIYDRARLHLGCQGRGGEAPVDDPAELRHQGKVHAIATTLRALYTAIQSLFSRWITHTLRSQAVGTLSFTALKLHISPGHWYSTQHNEIIAGVEYRHRMDISVFSNAESLFLPFYAVQRPSERFSTFVCNEGFWRNVFRKKRFAEGRRGDRGP